MENIEKINKIAAKEVEIQNKTSEIIERKTRFKMQIAKLMEEFEQSQNKLKEELNTLVQEHDIELKQELDKHFEKARDNFDKSYQEIIEECIYPLAAVDNMMFNLDKKLENEDKNKVKLKK